MNHFLPDFLRPCKKSRKEVGTGVEEPHQRDLQGVLQWGGGERGRGGNLISSPSSPTSEWPL